MTDKELVAKAKDIAINYQTTYIWGGFGAPITEATIQRAEQYSKNKTSGYAKEARKLSGAPKAFYFDCVGLIKAILWGWNGDNSKSYGGAKYKANGVPDIGADAMITKCTGISTSFSNVQAGEVVWMEGHIGIYIGNGLAVECTPKWDNGVQITAVSNIGTKAGYNSRKWTKHGKLPYVTYTNAAIKPIQAAVDPAKSFDNGYAKQYTVTASALNMRRGASTNKGVLKVLKKGEKVTCYGYYTRLSGTTWLYVKAEDGTIGYCSKWYLK